MIATEIAAMIDVSAVRAESTLEDVQHFRRGSYTDTAASVFLRCLPTHLTCSSFLMGVKHLQEVLSDFPGGSETTATKCATAAELVRMGCAEIDMVNNITWLKAGNKKDYIEDIRAVVEDSNGLPVKVILECHWLTDDEIVRGCEWSVEAGASWVKTGTGWAPTGATLENVTLMKQTVGERCQVKAAGGVRDLETLLAMYDRGVRRFGIGGKTAEAILDEAAGDKHKTVDESY